MPIKDSVTRAEIASEHAFLPARKVAMCAFEVAAFVHDGSDASDMYWDLLCDDMLEALDEWRVACGMKRLSWERAGGP
jgi:hypothetical protein